MASLVCPGICWSSHFSVLLKTRERMTFGEREPNPQSEDTLKRELQRGALPLNLVPFDLVSVEAVNRLVSTNYKGGPR